KLRHRLRAIATALRRSAIDRADNRQGDEQQLHAVSGYKLARLALRERERSVFAQGFAACAPFAVEHKADLAGAMRRNSRFGSSIELEHRHCAATLRERAEELLRDSRL